MISSTRRRLHPASLALATLVLLTGACADPPATSDSDSASSGSSGSSGGDSETTPTTDPTEDSGEPTASELRYFLRIDDDPVPPVRLEMDRAKVLEVFGEEATKNIKLLDVDSTPLLDEVLARIQSSCGDRWDNYDYDPADKADPNKPSKANANFPGDPNSIPNFDLPIDPAHDCSLTELGQTYGKTKFEWQHSPQFAMVRLLTMTPRNAVMKGTILEDFESYIMEGFFDKNPNGFTFADILAASLFCGAEANPTACTENLNDSKMLNSQANKAHEKKLHTRAFIPTSVLADVLKRTLMASHPNIANDQGLLPVTLYDALYDMKPLADKFGPAGDHPGLLMHDDADNNGVDEFTTRSDALTADFKMAAVADSNLRLVEGIDASVGAGSMFISSDPLSPLAFDFLDETKVQLLGIAQNPIVDMRMRIAEVGPSQNPPVNGVVPSCDLGLDPCLDNLPATPVGTEYIWSQPVWSLERIVAEAAYASFNDLTYPFYCFVGKNPCSASASIGKQPASAPGWTEFLIGIDGLEAPPAQYLWELLLSVAQVAVHNPAVDNKPIKEGDANPVFALKNLSIGLDAEAMIALIRPNLQAQAAYIANIILGKYWKHNARLDFYYRRATPEAPPVLFFVNDDDPRPDDTGEALLPFAYDKVGFFSDPALTDKVSSTQVDGVPEADHEKYRLPEGETVLYMQDDEQKTYRLRFFVPKSSDPTEIVVHVHAL